MTPRFHPRIEWSRNWSLWQFQVSLSWKPINRRIKNWKMPKYRSKCKVQRMTQTRTKKKTRRNIDIQSLARHSETTADSCAKLKMVCITLRNRKREEGGWVILRVCSKYTSRLQSNKGQQKQRRSGSIHYRSKQFSTEMWARRGKGLGRNAVHLLWSLSTSMVKIPQWIRLLIFWKKAVLQL